MKKWSLVFSVIFIFVIILCTSYIVIQKYRENQIEKQWSDYVAQNLSSEQEVTETESTEQVVEISKYPKAEVIEEYKGYTVCAKIEIPIIELETYVLKNYSVQALNVSVTKFWGVNPNEIGNSCIAGHNFKNKNMFRNLKKLNIGDKIIVSDNNIGVVEYEVFEINTVLPKDTSCLSQETNGKREITLITCTTDSKKRIIVKAKEIEERE